MLRSGNDLKKLQLVVPQGIHETYSEDNKNNK